MAANKVLLVDDDPSIIEVLKLYFEKEGYQVVTCMQGDKAFAVFSPIRSHEKPPGWADGIPGISRA